MALYDEDDVDDENDVDEEEHQRLQVCIRGSMGAWHGMRRSIRDCRCHIMLCCSIMPSIRDCS